MLLLRETRCGVDEIRHVGAVSIVDEAGDNDYGDTSVPLPMRSTAKPFMLAALLDVALGSERFSHAEIALMSSSHNGEPQHVAVLLDLLTRYNISPELLRCGTHEKWKDWSIPSPLGNNCSGKHAAFLIAAKVGGYHPGDYRDPESQLQRSVVERLATAFGQTPHAIGVDGCSIPTCAFPLRAIARGFRDYAADTLGAHCARVRAAQKAAGYYVGGTDRLESYLITHYGLAAKSGSDGLWALGVPDKNLGIAIKVWSGVEAAVQAVMLDILHRRGVLNVGTDPYLTPYHTRAKVSLTGADAGMIEVCFLERPSP